MNYEIGKAASRQIGFINMLDNGKCVKQFCWEMKEFEEVEYTLPASVGRKVSEGEELTQSDIMESVSYLKKSRSTQVRTNNFLRAY